jgi:Cytidylate kinase
MNIQPRFEKYLSFIYCQLHPSDDSVPARPRQWQAVTISRQAGSGAHAVAEILAGCLKARRIPNDKPWTVFDRNLVETVLDDYQLPSRLAKFMPEDRISEIDDAIEELCGLHPASFSLVDKTATTILRLTELGNVILLGRGANIITSRLDNVFNVRLVGSVERRANYLEKIRQIDHKTALKLIAREDLGRIRYLKKYYHADIDDPLLYHLIINTDLIGYQQAATLIVEAMLLTRTSSGAQIRNPGELQAA